MGNEYNATFQARWADMDFNGHMKNTSYLDYAADTRMLFFKSHGFDIAEFKRLNIGPVVFADNLSYHTELFMYQDFTVSLVLKGLSPDGARFCFVNEFRRTDGRLVARLQSDACWLDLAKRKITPPPGEIMSILENLKRTPDFTCIGSACEEKTAVA
ncbi:MAG: thioesterase [Spirochaetes bacterium]|nr:MAG: thioesterase [Spirochaetota bacterium]